MYSGAQKPSRISVRSRELRLFGIAPDPRVRRNRILPEKLFRSRPALLQEIGLQDLQGDLIHAGIDKIVLAENFPDEIEHRTVDSRVGLRLLVGAPPGKPRHFGVDV